MLYKVEGIVVRSIDYGESNKIVTLFSKQAGKIAVMARGAKKLKSRLTAVSQLLTCAEYVFFRSDTGGMGTLNHGEIIRSHHVLREDLRKAAFASYIVEMVDRMMNDREPNDLLYEQLKAALDAIESDKDPEIVAHIFEMRILDISGYSPEIESCASCGADVVLEHSASFSALQGGLLCPLCSSAHPAALTISAACAKLLRLFGKVDLRRLGKTDVKQQTLQELKQCMRQLMDAHIGIDWKARKFIDQLDKYDIK